MRPRNYERERERDRAAGKFRNFQPITPPPAITRSWAKGALFLRDLRCALSATDQGPLQGLTGEEEEGGGSHWTVANTHCCNTVPATR